MPRASSRGHHARPPFCMATPRPSARCSKPIEPALSPRVADRGARRHRQGNARLPHGALRACPSRSARAGGAESDIASRRCRSSCRAPHRGTGARRPSGARTHGQREDRQTAPGHPGRRRSPDGHVLRLDRRGGRMAGRHRRCGRRTQPRTAPTRCSKFWKSRRAARLLLLVSHSAGARAADHPLALPPAGAAAALGRRCGPRGCRRRSAETPTTPTSSAAAAAADGSVARALALLDGEALALRKRISTLLERLPAVDPRALHALGDASPARDPQTLAAFVDTVNAWLSARLVERRAGLAPASRAWPRSGRRSMRRARRRDLSISSASRWFSMSSAGLPRPRAVDTYARAMAGLITASRFFRLASFACGIRAIPGSVPFGIRT